MSVSIFLIAVAFWAIAVHRWRHRHEPALLSRVMAIGQEGPASFATISGTQRHPSVGVYLANLAVFTCIFLTWDPRNLQNPSSWISGVNGQYLIFARQAYEAIGTHA